MRPLFGMILTVALAATASAAEIGPQLGFPLPVGEVGDHQLGIHAGLTANLFDDSNVGMGLAVAYHDWPVSSEFKAAFERQFYGLLRIGAPRWEISALQMTGHVKVLAPLRSAARPWLQLGAGVYWVDPRLELLGERLDSKWEPGALVSLGFDYEANPRLRLGLDASYHHLWIKQDMGADFDAFEVGTHVLFGGR